MIACGSSINAGLWILLIVLVATKECTWDNKKVCVCVCFCLLACVLLWATSEEMKLFLLSSNLDNFSSNLLVGYRAHDQISFPSGGHLISMSILWRGFMKRSHDLWSGLCDVVYYLSMQGILHLLIGIRS